MKQMKIFPIQMLGQSGVKITFPDLILYVDPYLSNSVQEFESPDLERQLPIPISPEDVDDADVVLITHDHIDHCDPHTLVKLSNASPHSQFYGPAPVIRKLNSWGIPQERTSLASESWATINADARLRAVPAAHPEIHRDADGNLNCIGFLLEYCGSRLYFAGDTGVRQEIIDNLLTNSPIDIAFLPVNEQNFFRERRCILGNMTVREAFQFGQEIGARQVVAVHWDMFVANSTFLEEIRLIYDKMKPDFSLLIKPDAINLCDVSVSIIIRTLNEERYLEDLLKSIAEQVTDGLSYEVIVVDSGSDDATVSIAERYGCRIEHIARDHFSFGRSLNIGCERALGNIIVIVSGHCVPVGKYWLQQLCQPIIDGQAQYSYGRQMGSIESRFSESCIFQRYYPNESAVPQNGFFCNNANSAISKNIWSIYKFDEDLTGLEDLELAKRLVNDKGKVAYVASAAVIHHHSETWSQIRKRFEREAIALQNIMPQIQISIFDALRYFIFGTLGDIKKAMDIFPTKIKLLDIVLYRYNQYIGSWRGNKERRKLSQKEKDEYFYPR